MDFTQPISAAAYRASDWIIQHQASLPEDLRQKAIEAARQRSPVDAVVAQMEVLYAADKRAGGFLGDRPELLGALASVANQIAEGGFYEKGDRATEVIRYARREAGEIQGVNPDRDPPIEAAYRDPAELTPETPTGGDA